MFVRSFRPADDAHDHHPTLRIPNQKQHAPVAHPNPMEIIIKFLNALRPWLLPQGTKRGIETGERFMRHTVEFPLCARKEDNLVGHDAYAPDARRLWRYAS